MPNKKSLFLLISILLLIASYSCAPAVGCTSEACLRILFVGNSYTFVNDLPTVFAGLAKAGGHQVATGMVAQGGWTLSQHASSSDTLDKIKSARWNYVVLQEQSEIPAFPQIRTQQMYPAARQLASQIEATGATPVFFITWAHRDGMPDSGLANYETMQSQINQGYLLIAQELNAPIAPVGMAWANAHSQNPQLDLWQADGSHPTQQGTYLAACVFYAVLFNQNPEGLSYLGELSKETAHSLQTIAANTVLYNP